MKYVGRCVELNKEGIEHMVEHSQEITLEEFRRHAEDLERLTAMLGYSSSFPIENDWHVRYFKSHYRGRPCVYMDWSAIEFVFA
jgi:hypothetical protein